MIEQPSETPSPASPVEAARYPWAPAARPQAFAVALLGLAVGLVGCGDAIPPAPIASFDSVTSPAAPGSGEANLAVDGSGVVYLSWLEPSEAGHALRFARLADGEDGAPIWTPPRTVIDRPDLFVNWADFPSLAVLDDGTLLAHWLEMSGPGAYSYDVRVALSRDGGQAWADEMVLHRDGVQAEHGFVSLVSLGDRAAALWLDGRATPQGDPMTLRYTTVEATGERGPEQRVDRSVCDCCQTAMAPVTDGLIAAYRDRTEDEIRDIYVARYENGEWAEGRPVHRDGWRIAGCPVNGPSLATRGDTVLVAWFTASEDVDPAMTREEVRSAGERGRTLAAFSTDGGRTFGAPIRIDDGGSMGRVDAILLEGTAGMVSWLERTEDGAEVRVRRVDPDGVGPTFTVAGAAAARASGFPRMERAGERLIFAWTASGEAGGVRTAVARLPEAVLNGGSDSE